MTFDDRQDLRRRSIRLHGFDYAETGAYFITACTHQRACLFGDIVEGEMQLNAHGAIVRDEWLRTGDMRSDATLDVFVVMPNHFHAIVFLWRDDEFQAGSGLRSLPARSILTTTEKGNREVAPTADGSSDDSGGDPQVAPTGPKSRSIGAIMAGFKSAACKRINALRNSPGIPVWQRNYYEHIIRNDESLRNIREYVVNNPINWELDREHPNTVQSGVRIPYGRPAGRPDSSRSW